MLFEFDSTGRTKLTLGACLTILFWVSCVDDTNEFITHSPDEPDPAESHTPALDHELETSSLGRECHEDCPERDNRSASSDNSIAEECPPGFQDNDQDGICLIDCETARYSCSGNGRCNDSTGVAHCDCYAGFVNDYQGNCVPNGIMMTSVSDNLDPEDAEIFSSRLEHLGYSRKNWDQNVSGDDLAQYLGFPYALLYHTGHGYSGGIATSSGTLKVRNVTINARNTIFATCFTLNNTDPKEIFGPTAETIMGYTKQSFDITDNQVVDLYADYLGENQTHLSAWFLANSSIHNLSDRWVAFTREGDEIVEYAASEAISPIVWQSGEPRFVQVRNSLLVSDAVLSSIVETFREFGTFSAMELTGKREPPLTARLPFKNIEPTSLTLAEAREIADEWISSEIADVDDLFLDRTIAIQKKFTSKSVAQVIAYHFLFGRKLDGVMMHANGPGDHVQLTVGNNRVLFASRAWSTIRKTPAKRAPFVMQPADVIHKSADDIVRFTKGKTVHFINTTPAWGLKRASGSTRLEAAYAFLLSGGERIIISATTGEILD